MIAAGPFSLVKAPSSKAVVGSGVVVVISKVYVIVSLAEFTTEVVVSIDDGVDDGIRESADAGVVIVVVAGVVIVVVAAAKDDDANEDIGVGDVAGEESTDKLSLSNRVNGV